MCANSARGSDRTAVKSPAIFIFRSAEQKILVAAIQQAPRDDLRLDLGGALEDVEDARIAENARDRKLEGEAVAAVDLNRIVGRRPGDAGGKELGHAGLEI